MLKNREKKIIIELQRALENIRLLELSLSENPGQTVEDLVEANNPKYDDSYSEAERLRLKLREKLLNLSAQYSGSVTISPIILGSEAYKSLQQHVNSGTQIKEESDLWKRLEEVILQSSPHFLENLRLLLNGKLQSFDLHTAILVKCGVTPSQMSTLLCRSKTTISSRRESIGTRIFGQKVSNKVVDTIICLL